MSAAARVLSCWHVQLYLLVRHRRHHARTPVGGSQPLLLYQPSLLLLPAAMSIGRRPRRFSAACFVLLLLRTTLGLYLLHRRRLLLLLQGNSQRPRSVLPALLRRVVWTASCAAVALWYLHCTQARCERPLCISAGVQGPLRRRRSAAVGLRWMSADRQFAGVWD